MKARTALLDVLRDRRRWRGRFQQLEPRVAHRREMRPHLLRRHILGRLDVEAERVAVKSQRGVEILDGNADVIENGPHKNQAISDFRFQISDWRSLKIADCRLPLAIGDCRWPLPVA